MAEYLGTIQQLAGLSTHARTLVVFDNALIEARGSDAAAWGRLVAGAPGAAAGRRKAKKKADHVGQEADAESLAEADKSNRLIWLNDVESATLKKTKMRLYRELELTMSDGSKVSWSWQPGHNKDKVTTPLLERALGELLASS
jgi:hypothetical protein